MKAAGKRRRPAASVSASELAQMGLCERLVVFEHKYGKRRLPEQQAAIERGRREYERFFREGRIASARPGRCFIATLVFGEGPETQTLRAFRDQVLRRRSTGRRLIATYYRIAPGVCRMLVRQPWTHSVLRIVLQPVIWLALRWLSATEARRAP
jgi:hypothetical protein